MKGIKNLMLSLLGIGLGGCITPIVILQFNRNIGAGILSIFAALCLFVAAGYFATTKGGHDD